MAAIRHAQHQNPSDFLKWKSVDMNECRLNRCGCCFFADDGSLSGVEGRSNFETRQGTGWAKYCGGFVNGTLQGFGKYLRGSWRHNQRHGLGMLKVDRAIIRTIFRKNIKHGPAVISAKNGRIYASSKIFQHNELMGCDEIEINQMNVEILRNIMNGTHRSILWKASASSLRISLSNMQNLLELWFTHSTSTGPIWMSNIERFGISLKKYPRRQHEARIFIDKANRPRIFRRLHRTSSSLRRHFLDSCVT